MARTMVWGHGLTSSMAREDRAGLFRWRADGWDVHRYDAAGHGTSPVQDRDPARYRWERLAEDMLARAPERFVAGGASMGCATAIHAAVAAPDRVTAVVGVIPPTAWELRAAQRAQYEAGATVVETEGAARLRELTAARPVPAIFAGHPEVTTPDPDVAGVVLPAVLRGAAASDLPPRGTVATITVPVLLLAWDTDPVHPVATATELARLLPHAELHVADTFEELAAWPMLVAAFLRAC